MNQLKTMICCLLAGISASLSAQQTTTVVKDFRLAGPFAITTPYQTGNVDAKGRSFNDMTLLKQLQSAKTQLSKAKAMARKNEATDTATQQKAAAQTERWIIRKHAIEQEIKARKKK